MKNEMILSCPEGTFLMEIADMRSIETRDILTDFYPNFIDGLFYYEEMENGKYKIGVKRTHSTPIEFKYNRSQYVFRGSNIVYMFLFKQDQNMIFRWNMKVGICRNLIMGEKATFIPAPLSNIYNNGLVCMPPNSDVALANNDSEWQRRVVEMSISNFWESSFNADLSGTIDLQSLPQSRNHPPLTEYYRRLNRLSKSDRAFGNGDMDSFLIGKSTQERTLISALKEEWGD